MDKERSRLIFFDRITLLVYSVGKARLCADLCECLSGGVTEYGVILSCLFFQSTPE